MISHHRFQRFWHDAGRLRKAGFILLPLFLLVFGFFLFIGQTPHLEFKELSYPAGFRELVSEGGDIGESPRPAFTQVPPARVSVPNPAIDVCEALLQDPASPTAGDQKAPVTLVEFFDYRCPYCKALAGTIRRMRERRLIRVIYKEWPILGPTSTIAARAALAADRQGKYRAFHDALMRSGFIPTETYIDGLAAELGIDRSRLHADMKDEKISRALERTAALADALGFIGTPSLVVGRTIVRGAISEAQLESLLESEAETSSKGSNPC